ncbi:hypothetical protein [uncultured Reyranella sp.]|jgi:hypothetical protein|uniref:hypothetical protein n=1 Tax=uncultured Reyranella sp. TaxID=735512 RepID=UPI00259CC9B9|nr:hypothetical protein [uncultured Reyranella sp.]
MKFRELNPSQQIIVRRLALGLSLTGLGIRQELLSLVRLGLVTGNRDFPQLTDAGFACLHATPSEGPSG